MQNEYLDALRVEHNQIVERVQAFAGEIKTRSEGTTDEESELLDGCAYRAAELKAEIAKVEDQLERIASMSTIPGAVENEDTDKARLDPINVNVRTDPFDNLERIASVSSDDLRARAESVIESHLPSEIPSEWREGMTRTATRKSTRKFDADTVRQHIIVSSSPEYVRAFDTYVETAGSVADPILFNRAAMSLTAANGGVMVPQFLDPTIVLTNAGAENDVRQIAGSAQITVDQWDGVTSAGATAVWTAENNEFTDGTPTFVGPTITTHKMTGFIFGSYEVLADSGFDEVGMLIADAFDRLEETAFISGDGSGEPYGLVNRLSGTGPVVAGTSGGVAGTDEFVVGDVYALDNALAPRWRRNAKWLAAHGFYNVIRAATDTRDNFWQSFGGGQPAELIGYPTYRNEAMDNTIVSGSADYPLILGDFNQGYKVVDRVGTTVLYEPILFGANQLPTGQAGWVAYKRVGADVITSNAFRVLYL